MPAAIFPAARRAVTMLAVTALVAAAGAFSGEAAQAVVLRVATGAPAGRPIPGDFLGLALEYRSIPDLTGPVAAQVNPVLVQLIRNLVPRDRPVLRIGGQSTDRTWWPVGGAEQPLGITYDLTSRWITFARALAQATDARLILGLGLEARQPRIVAVEARQLLAGLGRDYIAGFEIGNEPELYPLIPWYRELHGAPIPWYSPFGVPVFARPAGYGPDAFYREFARTLGRLPGLPIAGPATGLFPWLDGFRHFLGRASPVRIVTWHAYGLNQCITVPTSPWYPTVPNLLSPLASRGIVNGISPYVALAHRAGAAFRIDEMNSVTCNGRLGVSDTFASALWVMDALFAIADEGVDGVNIHTFENAANGLFDFVHTGGHWEANVHPLYYGLMMFAQAAPPGSRLLRISSAPQDGVRAWATLAPDHRIRVLLINDSQAHSALALVRVPARPGPASIERLRAASAHATGGVSLGGASFASATATGVLAPPRTTFAARRAGAYAVTLPGASAALVTLAPGAGGSSSPNR